MDGNWYLDPATGWWTLTVPTGSTLVSVLNWAGRYSGVTNAELLTQEPTGSGLSVTVLGFTDDALTLRTSGAGAVQPIRVSFANSQQEIVRLSFVAPSMLSPVTLDEAKAFLRVQTDDDDATITVIVNAVKDWIEQHAGVILNQRQLTVSYPTFGPRVPIVQRPLVSVDTVVYDDLAGAVVTLASNEYRLRDFAGMQTIVPLAGHPLPMTNAEDGAVRVTITAGYASNADIPAPIKQAALLLIAHWYDNRDAVTAGAMVELPFGVAELLMPYRRRMAA